MSDIIKTVGQTFSTDDIGVTTWTCRYYVASKDDYHKAGADAPIDGLIETNRQGNDQKGLGEDGGKEGMIVTVTYEGIVDLKFAGVDNARVEFDASYTEEPLEAHPDWINIRDIFQGRYDDEAGKVVFPQTLPASSRVDAFDYGLSFDKSSGGDELKNPMFGEETFLSLGAVFRRTYAATGIPDHVISLIGKVHESLPSEYKNLDSPDRNWLQQPFKISRRGGAYIVVDELLQSPIGGWNKALYDLTTVKG